ncbi:hypothetical protein TSOC_007540 [Tetrabaena socialis]|uniref:Kazal-like domain-containing protein n=1 Tax=Tetrabaena socialis TaxID=47790 RepID=A0A2J8A0T1_9CHLO|nr:hypothetical protein TSOC_007540 [Tetrabaena socialis]|eukprot:PNH06129.1 hypothetical protein TSOC_007540 [Tetrabaena socialis]
MHNILTRARPAARAACASSSLLSSSMPTAAAVERASCRRQVQWQPQEGRRVSANIREPFGAAGRGAEGTADHEAPATYDCAAGCHRAFKPACGTDGRTYGSACLATCQGEPCTDPYLYHKCDTAAGQSGSPLWMMAMTAARKMGPFVRAVHNIEWVQELPGGRTMSYINSAVSMTPEHYRSVLAWIAPSFEGSDGTGGDGTTTPPMGPALPPNPNASSSSSSGSGGGSAATQSGTTQAGSGRR